MTLFQKIALTSLRIVLGWFFFYAGITKIMNPAWTAAGYIKGAQTFSFLYQALLHPTVLTIINHLVAWGLTLIGISLIIGCLVRISAWSGIALMFLFYFPILQFPYPDAHSFIVDQHIIYSFALLVLLAFKAEQVWGFTSGWTYLKKRYGK